MKSILLVFFVIMFAACQKDSLRELTSVEQAKKPSTSGRKIFRVTPGKGKYQTLASVQTSLTLGSTVIVDPGVYNEPLILQDGVDYVLDGVTIDYQALDTNGVLKPSVTDAGFTVTCTLSGNGILKRTNSQGSVIEATNGSSITITNTVQIFDDPTLGAKYGAINVNGGNIDFTGNVSSHGISALVRSGSLVVNGVLTSDNDVAFSVSGTASVGVLNGTGYSHSLYSPGVEVGAGQFTLNGSAIADNYYGMVQSGGVVTLQNSIVETKHSVGDYYIDAYNFDNGDGLTISGTTFKVASVNGFSIASHNGQRNVTISDFCFGNRPVADDITLSDQTKFIIQ